MIGKVLSVVVPIGPGENRISCVAEWLAIALAEEIEVILVHDSQDLSEKEKFKELIELNAHENLKGISVDCANPGQSRNEGLTHASSSWVTFWDSDDLPLIKDFLNMVHTADSDGFEICIGGFRTKDVKSSELNYFSLLRNSKGVLEEIAAYPRIWRFAFQLRLVKNIDFESFPMCEDQAFLLRAVSNLDAISYHPEPVYEYRIGSGKEITSIALKRKEILTSITWLHNNKETLSQYPLYEYFLVTQKLTSIKTNLKNDFKKISFAVLKNSRFKHISIVLRIMASRRKINEKGKLLTLYVSGGLGNQLFQISRALTISPQRQIRVIDTLGKNSTNEVIQHFKPESLIMIETSGWKKVINKILVSWMLRSTSNNLLSIVLQRCFAVPAFLCKLTNGRKSRLGKVSDLGFQEETDKQPNVLIGYFQSYLYVDKELLESKMDLKMSRIAKLKIEDYREQAIIQDPILVHVRLGDYLNESSFGVLGIDYYLKAIYEIEEKQGVQLIWLFSNDPQKAFEIFPQELQKRIKVVSEPGLTAMENLQIMRLCNKFIIANSTYGWWSAQLTRSEYPEVYYPKPWFLSMNDPHALAPKTWNPILSNFNQ